MQNDMRDRLMDLLFPASADLYENKIGIPELADHLIANGVIVPPCKVGDKIYRIVSGGMFEWEIVCIQVYEDGFLFIDDSDNFCSDDDFGKTVFLTKEEAEQKLKELSDNG